MNDTSSTLSIFRRLHDDIPPLVPRDVSADMFAALEQCENNMHLTRADLEATMIIFGKKIWPYREAFLEFYRVYEGELGEKFLLRRLPRETQKKYAEFKKSGGTFRDLHSGSPAAFFTVEERVVLCAALVEVNRDLSDYARQAVVSRDEKKYRDRIQEFMHIFADIERQLGDLLQRADKEQEHPELAAEIREHVRGFEYSFCLLGPPLRYEAVCQAPEHFDGRKQQKKIFQSYV